MYVRQGVMNVVKTEAKFDDLSNRLGGEKTGVQDFLVVQWLRPRLPAQRVQVGYLVGGLRSHTPRGQKTKTQNRSNIVIN